MANNKITQLTELAAAPESTDVLPIVDLSASETKKVTVSNLTSSKADKTIQIIAGTGMSGGGTLESNRTLDCTITQYTDELAQDSIGSILTDSSSIDFTYNDTTPSITAVVLPAGVDHNSLNNDSANRHIDHSAVSVLAGDGLSGRGTIAADRTLTNSDKGSTAVTTHEAALDPHPRIS